MSKAYFRDEKAYSDLNSSILVKNLVDKMARFREEDIERIFSPFGEIKSIEIEFDPQTGNNLSCAVVRYGNSADANAAIKKMNGYLVASTPLIVTNLPPYFVMGSRIITGDEKGRGPVLGNMRADQSVLVTKITSKSGNVPQEDSLTDSKLETQRRRLKQDRFYLREPSKTIGIFNLFDSSVQREVSDRHFRADCLSEVKSKLMRHVSEVRRDSRGLCRLGEISSRFYQV